MNVHVRLTLADVARFRGEAEQATDLYEQALPELERIGARRCTASTLKNIATLAFQAGHGQRAVDLYTESISIRRDLGDEGGLAECREGLAVISKAAGRTEEAVTLFGVAHSIRETCCGRLSSRAHRGRRPARCPTSGPWWRDF